MKFVAIVLMPFVCFIIVIIGWLIYWLFKEIEFFKQKIIGSMVVTMFMLHP